MATAHEILKELDKKTRRPARAQKVCQSCKGSGKIDITVRAPRIVKCLDCDGTGLVDKKG